MSYTSNISHGSHQNNDSPNQTEKDKEIFKSIVDSWYDHTLNETELLERVKNEFALNPFQQEINGTSISIKKVEKQNINIKAKTDATSKQTTPVQPELKSDSPAFIPSSAIKKPYVNRFDDGIGIYFSFYLTHLKNVLNENFHIKFKAEVLACTLKTEIQKGHEDKSHLFFLSAFQICAYLPADLQNDVFKILVEDFKHISFANTCPLTHALHTLTFSRKKSFSTLLNFLNVLSLVYLNNDASTFKQISQIEMTYKTNSRFENAVPHPISAIHLKTDSHALTLEIPFQPASFFKQFDNEIKLLSFIDLLIPLFPKVCLDSKKQFLFENLESEKIVEINTIEDSARDLTLHSNPVFRLLGLRFLINFANNKKIDFNSFEKIFLKNLTLFIFSKSNGEPDDVLSQVKKLGIGLLSDLKIDMSLPLNLQRTAFIKNYIQVQLQHKDANYQKMALQLWKEELFSTDSEIQKDWIAFGQEIYSILASKALDPKVADKLFKILKELIDKKAISPDFKKPWLAEFGLKICESTLNANSFSSFSDAFNQWSIFNSISLFDLKGYRLKEHLLIVQLANMLESQKETEIENYSQQLYPKLFAFSLSKEMYLKFRVAFINYLKDLSLIGHESEVLKLLKNQIHQNLSKIELEIIQLNGLQVQAQESKKIETLLKISKQSLSKESKTIVTNLSLTITKSLLSKNEIASALELMTKTLFDEVTHLFSFLTTILKEEIISDKKSCHHILNIILSSKQISGDDLRSLIESSVEKLKSFPNDLKNNVRKIHLNIHQELMKSGQQSKAVSFLKTILKELNIAEIFLNAPEQWLEILKFSNGEETLEFKNEILKSLLANKVFNSQTQFYQIRNASQELISSYFACNMPEKAIEFAIYFQNFEIIHDFSENSLGNFNECLVKSLDTKDTVKSLTFLRVIAEKNKGFIADENFLALINVYLDILFERKDYVKWMEAKIEFAILEKDAKELEITKEVILSTLDQPSLKKNSETIFAFLVTTLHPNINLWHALFKKIKENNFADLKIKIAYELKDNADFRNLFNEKIESVLNCFPYLLEFVSSSKDMDIAYTLMTEYPEFVYEMVSENSNIKEVASLLLASLLGKLFRHLKNNPLKKQALLKKIIPSHSKTTFSDSKQKWIFKKLILDATCEENDTDLLVAGASNLFSLTINPIFETCFKELIPSLLQILKRWPELQPKNVKCYIKLDTSSQPHVSKDTEKKEVDINYLFCQTANLLMNRDNSTDTYFEQYYHLIGHKSENYQLLAMLLYKKSLVALEKTPKSTVSLKSQTAKIANNHLLQLAFESQFPSVYLAALDVFHRESYRVSLKIKDSLSFAQVLIDKIMEKPAESYLESHDINNICQLFTNTIRYPEPNFIDYYMELNKKVLAELKNPKLYLVNHNFMFMYLSSSVKSGIKNLGLTIRLINLVAEGWNLIKEHPEHYEEMHVSFAKELEFLIHSRFIDSILLDQIFQNFLFANDHIWNTHEEEHMKMIGSLLNKPNKLNSNPAFYLLFKNKFIEKSGQLITSEKAKILMSLIKKIDKNTPVTILSRVLHNLLAQKEHLKPAEFSFCISHLFKTIRTNIALESDGTIFAVIHWMKFIFFEKNKEEFPILFDDEESKILPSFLKLYKTDSKMAITLYIDYVSTIKHLISSTTDKIFYYDCLRDIIGSDLILAKNGIVFKDTEDILSYVNLFLDFTMPFELQFPNKPMYFPILSTLLGAKTSTSEMKLKKQQLIIRVLNYFITLSLTEFNLIPLKICLSLLSDSKTFHANFGLMESNYQKASDLIYQLKKKLSSYENK